jgi:alkylated DNA nucleotide flippase Atl1
MVLKLEYYGKQIRNTWKVLKFGAGEGWRSVGQIMLDTKKHYLVSWRRGIHSFV